MIPSWASCHLLLPISASSAVKLADLSTYHPVQICPTTSKFIQRRYKKDADFTEFVIQTGDSLAEFVQEQLAPLVKEHGAHVHERRHRLADPELARLTLLDTMIDVFGHVELDAIREQSRKNASAWLIAQIRHFSDLAWHLFDEVCRGFSDGILLEIERIIVPLHLKDDPNALE